MSDLYSADVECRYQATLRAGTRDCSTKWPLGCGGAANAFLVLLGPSMGAVGAGKTAEKGGADRPHRSVMRIGPDVMSYLRPGAWTRLCADMLGGGQYVRALSALLNLDWRHTSREGDIPDADLSAGLERDIWPLLPVLRPRLVAALTNRVWKTVLPLVENLRVPYPPCPVVLPRAPVVFRLSKSAPPSILLKVHNHPSRFLSYAQIAELGRACKWFLESAGRPATGCRSGRGTVRMEPRR